MSEKLFRCDARIASLRDRERFYRNVKEEFEGYKFSVKKLLGEARKNAALSARLKGVIADIVHCDEQYEVAVETAFGGATAKRRRHRHGGGRALPHRAPQAHQGRAGHLSLPVAALKPRYETDYTRKALREPGAVGLATDLVRFDEYYANVVYNLIGNTLQSSAASTPLVADTIASATAIAKKYPHAFRIVTLDGRRHRDERLDDGRFPP